MIHVPRMAASARRIRRAAAALALGVVVLASVPGVAEETRGKKAPPPPPPGKRFVYEYDAAGRLVRVGDGSGRYLVYGYDASGNVTGTRTTRQWHVTVRKPTKGAWVLAITDAGVVSGHGGDDQRGFFEITGSLAFSGGAGTGSIDLVDPESAQTVATFDLAGSTQTDDDSGVPLSLTLTSTAGADGVLSAQGARPGVNFGGFSGSFAHKKNLVKVGKTTTLIGQVALVDDGARAATSLLSGLVGGALVRDPKGKAYGTVTYDGQSFAVASRLKDGAKSVRCKTAKKAPTAFQLKVRR